MIFPAGPQEKTPLPLNPRVSPNASRAARQISTLRRDLPMLYHRLTRAAGAALIILRALACAAAAPRPTPGLAPEREELNKAGADIIAVGPGRDGVMELRPVPTANPTTAPTPAARLLPEPSTVPEYVQPIPADNLTDFP